MSLFKTYTTPLAFGGLPLTLDTRRVLWLEAESTLIAADLHIGKSQSYAHHATLLPPFDSLDTLARLEAILRDYAPKRFIALGDSFHDARSYAMLPAPVLAKLAELQGKVEDWLWVLGNHDYHLANSLPGASARIWQSNGVTFAHDDSDEEANPPRVIGHYHPKATVHIKGKRLSRHCFMWDEGTLILPAFGAYTGGLDTQSEPLQALFPEGHHFMLADMNSALKLSSKQLEAL